MYACAIAVVGGSYQRNGNRVQETSWPSVYKVRRQLLLLGRETTNGR